MSDDDDRLTPGQTLASMTRVDQAYAAQGLIVAAQLQGFPLSTPELNDLRLFVVDILERRPVEAATLAAVNRIITRYKKFHVNGRGASKR
jgi:hypothetical protein